MPQPDENEHKEMKLPDKIHNLSKEMLRLAPGPLAELRRMDIGGVGAPAFWRLAAACGFLDGPALSWMRIVKIMAILTPKGERSGQERLHQKRDKDGRDRSLGSVLCDGGQPGWPSTGQGESPALSETRLARLLAGPANERGPTLERITRALASRRDPTSGVDCTDIARLLLFPDDPEPPRTLAREYYRRLDLAARQNSKEKPEQ
jgi:CRISPR system Cascade subunit CasB